MSSVKKITIKNGQVVTVDESKPQTLRNRAQPQQEPYNPWGRNNNNFNNNQQQNNQNIPPNQQVERAEDQVDIPYGLIAIFFLLMEAILFRDYRVVMITAFILILVLTFFVWRKK